MDQDQQNHPWNSTNSRKYDGNPGERDIKIEKAADDIHGNQNQKSDCRMQNEFKYSFDRSRKYFDEQPDAEYDTAEYSGVK